MKIDRENWYWKTLRGKQEQTWEMKVTEDCSKSRWFKAIANVLKEYRKIYFFLCLQIFSNKAVWTCGWFLQKKKGTQVFHKNNLN